ncbi:MAG: hypothetical protein ACUVTN_12450 [Thermodesulfobacteriota bacterium]
MKGSQGNVENLATNDEAKGKVFNMFSFQKEGKSISSGEKNQSNEINHESFFSFVLELIHRIRGSLAAMKTLAFYSRENFRDIELGDYFYKIVSEDIEKTLFILDCFCDYLSINTPVKKSNTINNMLEEILRENQKDLEDKKIKIVKKQLDPELPETSVMDEHLKFILNSLFQYLIFSITFNGRIGILTRTIESQNWNGEGKELLQKDMKYIEILIISTHLDSKGLELNSLPPVSSENHEENIDLILQMVKKIIEKNRGLMDTKIYSKKDLKVISLLLPIERRNIFQFLLPTNQPKRWERKD